MKVMPMGVRALTHCGLGVLENDRLTTICSNIKIRAVAVTRMFNDVCIYPTLEVSKDGYNKDSKAISMMKIAL